MPTYPVKSKINGVPTFENKDTLNDIMERCEVGGAIKVLSPLEHHTDQQRKWLKGILLPALSKDNGDSVRQWEIKILSTIFPEDVEYYAHKNQVHIIVPSISQYGKRKMNKLIDEVVPILHGWGFTWVTYPDPTLRR